MPADVAAHDDTQPYRDNLLRRRAVASMRPGSIQQLNRSHEVGRMRLDVSLR